MVPSLARHLHIAPYIGIHGVGTFFRGGCVDIERVGAVPFDALTKQRELYNDMGTVVRGYVIYPDGGRGYSVVEVRDHRYLPDDPTKPIYTKVEAAALHDLERVVVDRVTMSPGVALDTAIDLWDESQRPVCLYLNGYGKVVFDDFWESVITYGDDGASKVFSYLGYSQKDVNEVIQIRVDSTDWFSDAIREAIGLDRCLPQPAPGVPIYLNIPKAAVDVWQEYSWDEPSAQGIGYITGHPIVKSTVRAFFDLAVVPPVKISFDMRRRSGLTALGWYREAEETVYINYGSFAPFYVMGVLDIGDYSAVGCLDAFVDTVTHEMTHHAELGTGFAEHGEWGIEQTNAGNYGVPLGSERFAVASGKVGAYALREYDRDFVRYHIGSALNIAQAISEINESESLREFQYIMGYIEYQLDGKISRIHGTYEPSRYGSVLSYDVWLKVPETQYSDLMRVFDKTPIEVLILRKTVVTQRLTKAPYERQWVNLELQIHVPVSDQVWIEHAYLKYPNRSGLVNQMS